MAGPITVQTKSLAKDLSYEGTTVLTYQIDYPVLTSFTHSAQAAKINASYKEQAYYLARVMEAEYYQLAVEGFLGSVENGYPFAPYQVLRTVSVPYALDCTASIVFDRYEFTGGAHGNTVRQSDTWNLRTGEKRALCTLFPGNSGYRADLIGYVVESVSEQSELFYDDAASLAADAFNDESFYLTDDAVVIYYQQYDIAPYAYGIPEFPVPYGMFGAALPRCAR